MKAKCLTNIYGITETEIETALYVAIGLTVKEIATRKGISFAGVESQTTHIRIKMKTTTICSAVVRMIVLGIISMEELKKCLFPPHDPNNK